MKTNLDGSAQGRRHPGRRLRARCRRGAALPLRRHRHADQGARPDRREGRPGLPRGAQPRVELAEVAAGPRRQAHVPRPRPARRRALPAAGGHEGRGRTRRSSATSATSAALLRDKKIYYSGLAREGERIVIRFREREQRAAALKLIADEDARPHRARAGSGRRGAAHRHDQARGGEARPGAGAAAEHPDAAQPRERARRGRADRAAAGRGPHRGAAGRRAGSRAAPRRSSGAPPPSRCASSPRSTPRARARTRSSRTRTSPRPSAPTSTSTRRAARCW